MKTPWTLAMTGLEAVPFLSSKFLLMSRSTSLDTSTLMPHYHVTIGTDGPVIDLAVAPGGSWRRRLAAQGAVIPSPTIVRALIDTGSDLSVVHPLVLQQLGAQATGSIRVRRPGEWRSFPSRLPLRRPAIDRRPRPGCVLDVDALWSAWPLPRRRCWR